MKYIDVWNYETFDAELTALLEAAADLICNYMVTDHQIFLSHDLGRDRSLLRPDNPHASDFYKLKEVLGREMEKQTIRAFHYTRLTDAEVAILTHRGVHLSTPETLRERFDALVVAGDIAPEAVTELYAASPFHQQLEVRSGKFWMTSHPIAIQDRGVEPLMAHWGGEVASMWMRDSALLARLALIGRPRIIELAVPLKVTNHCHSAAEAVVATFGRSKGCIPSKNAFDVYTMQPLPREAVLAVHTEGDVSFIRMGHGYPEQFVDVDCGRWTELTGEDE